MAQYAIVEISGRQYKVEPNKDLLVDFLGEEKNFKTDKVILKSENGKVELGTPYLKETMTFDVIEPKVQEKIRVATYHAKANTRKVKGGKKIQTKLRLHA